MDDVLVLMSNSFVSLSFFRNGGKVHSRNSTDFGKLMSRDFGVPDRQTSQAAKFVLFHHWKWRNQHTTSGLLGTDTSSHESTTVNNGEQFAIGPASTLSHASTTVNNGENTSNDDVFVYLTTSSNEDEESTTSGLLGTDTSSHESTTVNNGVHLATGHDTTLSQVSTTGTNDNTSIDGYFSASSKENQVDFSLPQDTYSLMIIGKPCSTPWTIGLSVWMLHCLLFSCLMYEFICSVHSSGSNYFSPVRRPEATACFLVKDNVSIWSFIDLNSNDNQALGLRFYFSNVLKFLLASCTVFCSLVVVFNAESRLGLLMNFSAFMTLSLLDSAAFTHLAEKGYCGNETYQTCKYVVETKVFLKQENVSCHLFVVLCFFYYLVILLAAVVFIISVWVGTIWKLLKS